MKLYPSEMKAEVIDLEVMKHYAAAVLDREFLLESSEAIEFTLHELPERLARQIVAKFRVPTDVLQDNTEIARYPTSLWDHIKKTLRQRWPRLFGRLTYREASVRLNEHLVYPHVPVQPYHADRVRLWVMPEVHISDQ